MLKANVGLSRKVSRDYQSTGYSINIDGEIPFSPDDAEGVLEKIRELFGLAQEAIDREIDRDQGEMSIGRHDEVGHPPLASTKVGSQRESSTDLKATLKVTSPVSESTTNRQASEKPQDGSVELATNKQVQFILTMGKRFKLSKQQLDNRILQIVGRQCDLYALTKREAGRVLDQLTAGAVTPNQTA